MQTTKRLIILLTDSHNDRGLMLQEGNIKDREVIYIECDEGEASNAPAASDATAAAKVEAAVRLLCVVLWTSDAKPEDNAARLAAILDERKGRYRAVIGTHNLGYRMEDALDVAVISERHPEVPITQYSTAIYPFVQRWSVELSGAGTDAVNKSYVQYGFDRLYALLKKGQLLTTSRRVALIKHRLSNLLLPVDNDLQGLHETGFAADYWKEVNAAYGDRRPADIFARAAALIYSGDGAQDNIEKIYLEAEHEFPEAKGAIESAWQGVSARLTRAGAPDVGEAKLILEDLGNPQKLETVRAKCGKYNNDFHAWFVSLMDALEDFRRKVAEAEPRDPSAA